MYMKKIEGVLIPLASAIDDKERINESQMRKLARYVCKYRPHAVVTSGSTGEFFGLDFDDHKKLLEIVLHEVNGRCSVFAGTGAVTTKKSIKLIEQAEKAGADGALVITPFYITPTQEDLYAHYSMIASATDLPIIVYSNPARTGSVCPNPDTIVKLSKINNIVALKDSSGNLALTAEYISKTKDSDFSILMGQDKLFYAGLMQGCKGVVAATANVAPKLLMELYEAFINGDYDRCKSLQEKVTILRNGFESLPFPVAAKAMIREVGVDVGLPFAPLARGCAIQEDILLMLKRMVAEAGDASL